MRPSIKLFLIVLAAAGFLLLSIGPQYPLRFSHAATINAPTCGQADVQNAINAAADGDTVTVPAGACTWGSQVTINNKSITLQGAGTGCDTILTPNGHPPASCTGTSTNITTSNAGGISVTDDTKPFRITGFRFNKNNYDGTHTIDVNKNNAYLSAKNATPWRIDHVYFNGNSGHISVTGARNFGLTDHNFFYVPNGTQIFLFWGTGTNETNGTSNLSALAGQDAHSDPVSLGSANALYIEDSEFFTNVWQGSQNILDGTAGQRVVLRNSVVRGPMVENHGACSGGARGTYTWEIYNNDIYPQDWNGTTGYQWAGIRLRGGTGVIYNNRFYGTWDSGAGEIYFDNQRTATYVASDCATPVNTLCDGTAAIDTNSVAGRTGPLCLDQVGGGSGAIGSQQPYPAYIWNNVNKGSGSGNTTVSPLVAVYNGTTPIVVNRDYFNSAKAGYVAFTYPYPIAANGFPNATPSSDTTPPSTPTSLAVTTSTTSTISLGWTASVDNVGVTGYAVYRGGVQIGTSPTNAYTDTGLTPNSAYTYTVSAYDAAGNTSAQSISVGGTTQSLADTTPPTTSITAPANNATVSGTTSVTATASDNIGVTKVELWIDGALKTTDTASPYTFSLDTTTLTNAAHTLQTKAYDAAGNVGTSASVSVTVSNGGGGTGPWSGILAPSRATDWTQAGVPGGIPNRTTICANVAAGETTASIQSKMNACPEGQVVLFGAGAFNLTSSIYANKGIVLRGAGPTQTTINLGSGTDIYLGLDGTGFMGGVMPSSALGSTNWTGGLAKGSTVLTLTSTAGISAGQNIVLDQYNASYVYPFGVEGQCTSGNSCGRNDNPLQFNGAQTRAQEEIVHVVSVDSGTQITIGAPGVAYDHSASLSPQAFFWTCGSTCTGGPNSPGNIKYAGVENMKVNANGNDFAVSMPYCDYCWAKNIAVTNMARSGVFFWWGYRDEVRDSYFSASNSPGAPTEYGIEMLQTTFPKVENNIFFGVTANILPEGSYGAVLGYNYTLNTASGPQFSSFEPHLAHNYLQLYEGNVVTGIGYDNSWGSSSQNTTFRNYVSGNSPNKNNYRYPMAALAHNQYLNMVANVLGDPTYHAAYACDQANPFITDNYIYDLGFFDGCQAGITSAYPYDPMVESTLMRWGNWDAVTWKANGNTNGVRYCTGAAAGNPACTTSETASAAPTFPGLASPATTFPASFYLASKPSWFNSVNGATNVIWPAIGPDVACASNCNTNTANHAAIIPAELCYMNSAKDANGFLTAFDASTCYQGAYGSGGGTSDTTPPSVSMTAPVSGSSYPTSSSAITVSASASDNVGVAQVQFTLDGANLGTPVTAAPYQAFLNPATLALGTHTLSAIASDAAGNVGTATAITITITTGTGGGGGTGGQVVFDAVGPSSAGAVVAAGTSLTWNHTVTSTGTNTLLTVAVAVGANNDGTLSLAATYNGVAMTSFGKVHSNNQTAGFVQLFYLKAPAAGTHAVLVTATGGSADMEGGSVSFAGVDQTTPLRNLATAYGYSAAPSVTVTSAAGDMVVDALANGSSITSSGKTLRWMRNQNGATGAGDGAQSTAAGASSVTMSYVVTSDWWGIVGADVVAAASTTPPPADTTPPSVPSGLAVTGTTTSTVSLAWTASTDNVGVAGYRIYRGGVQVATTTAPSYVDAGLAPNSAYTYTVSAYDAAGNASALSAGVSATTAALPDTTPPSVSMTAPVSGSSYPTSSSAITVSASASDNVGVTQVQFTLDGANLGTPVTAAPYQAFLNPATLALGTHTLSAIASDAAGNTGTATNVTITITAPSQTLTAALSASVISGIAPLTISLTATAGGTAAGTMNFTFYCNRADTGTNVTTPNDFSVNGTATNPYTATNVCTYGTPGTYAAKVIIERGAAPAAQAQATVTVSLDGTAPSVPSGLTVTGTTTSTIAFAWTPSTDNVGVAGYQVFRCAGSTCTASTQIATTTSAALTDAGLAASTTYRYRVKAYDAAMNLSGYSSALTVTTQAAAAPPDTTSPTAALTAPVSSSTVAGTVTVAGTATDNVGVASVQFVLDGQPLGSALTLPPYQLFWNTFAATNGAHTLRMTARDAAGNVGNSATVTVTVLNAPTVALLAPADGATLTGQAQFVATASSSGGGNPTVQFVVDGQDFGLALATPPYQLFWNTLTAADGAHTLRVKALDAGGNQTISPVTNVTVANNAAASLTASLAVAAATGATPLTDSLTATAGGTGTGTLNYTFYCNNPDTSTNLTTPYDFKVNGTSSMAVTGVNICVYSSAGTYTPKVIIEQGTNTVMAQGTVVASAPIVSPPPSGGGGGGGGGSVTPPPSSGSGTGGSGSSSQASAFPRTLTTGDTGADVFLLQIVLRNLGYLPTSTPLTSTFGIATQHALLLFQRDHLMNQSGNLDIAAQTLMNKVVAGNPAIASAGGNGGSTPATSVATPAAPGTAKALFTRNLYAGTKGDDVTALQNYLVAQAYLAATPTGYYGLLTQAAVQKFQCAQGLVCTGSPGTTGYGSVGPKTRAALNILLGAGTGAATTTTPAAPAPATPGTRTLFPGLAGDDVKALQDILINDGFLAPGMNTGYFGLLTEKAVQAFQCAEGIVCQGTPDTTGYGIVGPKTRGKL